MCFFYVARHIIFYLSDRVARFQGVIFDQENILRVDVRIALLAAMLVLVGCMPAKHAAGPGTTAMTKQDALMSDRASGLCNQHLSSPSFSSEDTDPVDILPEREPLADSGPLSPEDQDILDTEISFPVGLNTEENADVQRYFHEYAHKHRQTMEEWLKRAQLYLPYIRERFVAEGLPEDLIYLPFAESGFNPFALSRAGASGLWQFMPKTGTNLGLTVNAWIDERRDPYASTEAAIVYLKRLHQIFDDWSLALAAYNAGSGTIGKALEQTGTEDYFSLCAASKKLSEETKVFVPRFLALVKIARNLEVLGFEPIDWDRRPAPLAKLQAKPGTDLLELARTLGMDWKTFREINPILRKQEASPQKGVSIAVPEHLVASAQEYLKRPIMIAHKTTPGGGYKVRSGDSWWSIAKKHGVSVAKLQAANKASNNQILQVGKVLTIPGMPTADTTLADTRKWAERRANYIVQQGDSIWSIAKAFKTDPATLLQANGLNSKSTLKIGQKLYIADAGSVETRQVRAKADTARQQTQSYTVRSGDSLWSIARKFDISIDQLCQWNKVNKKASLRPGDELMLYP